MPEQAIPEALRAWPGHTGNWGRWPNDRGTLNLVTPAVVLRGLAAARTGEVIACARPVTSHDPVRPTPGAWHKMISAGDYDLDVLSAKDGGYIRTHSVMNTHIDAFAHIGYKGFGFNGRPFAETVSMEQGAMACDIAGAGPVVTRGVFVDVARRRGVAHLLPGEPVRVEELRHLDLLPGDAVVIRIGGTLEPGLPPNPDTDPHGVIAGLDAACIAFLASKDISVLATDFGADVFPPDRPEDCKLPVHVLALTFYGIHIVHNMDLERLGEVCVAQGRDDFLFVVSPLNFPRVTGSPATPLAIL